MPGKRQRQWDDKPGLFILREIPPQAEEHEVKLAIARIYHAAIAPRVRRRTASLVEEDEDPGLMNFRVELEKMPDHSGLLRPTGTLLLPCWAPLFREYSAQHPVMVPYFPDWNDKSTVASARLIIHKAPWKSDGPGWSPAGINHLKSSPWIDPRRKKEYEDRQEALQGRCQVTDIQFGFDHFETRDPRQATQSRSSNVHRFCVEWARAYQGTDTMAFLYFSDKLHAIEIRIGDHTSSEYLFIKVRYETIKRIAIKEDRTLIFSLWAAPILEKGPLEFHEDWLRSRLSGFDEQHRRVLALFSKQFRVKIYSEEELDLFLLMSDEVGLAVEDADPSLDEHDGLGPLYGKKYRPGEKLVHLSVPRLQEIDQWLKTIPFPVAFQVAALMYNGLLNPIEIRSTIRPLINRLLLPGSKHTSDDIAELILHFSRTIPTWSIEERLEKNLECLFNLFKEKFWATRSELVKSLRSGWFRCYRATITPTSVWYSGPSQEQSNGIIRKYDVANECFLRVNLTDEERLQLRWDHGVDGDSFVKERFGSLLKSGLTIAGRHYDFLAFSNSGLKEHSVWFVTPFYHQNQTWITAEEIRRGIGDFSKKPELQLQPAKLGARLAQAFSTTEPSITLKEGELEIIPDIAPKDHPKDYQFTDGYGCISLELAAEIWREVNPNTNPLPQPAPAAYQVRIGGAKGVLGINPELTGRKVILHESMVKFPSEDRGVHVALKFDHPLPLFLNRPLVAVLEHQGIKLDWFLRLQEKAIGKASNALLSISEEASEFLGTRHLGRSYGFPYIMRCLARYGMTRPDLEDAPHPWLDFFLTSLNIAMVHVDRELKYRARISIPSGYSLVGVADVHKELEEGQVYICTQRENEEHKYYPAEPGNVYVTRSPSIHPGDVQKFKAMHPFKGSKYEQYPMVNCIVFSCRGSRPPASMLGGGDLDGDLFQIIPESEDFKPEVEAPASYEKSKSLELDRPATIEDIANFVVDFVNSDRMGIIAIQHLIISDQSRLGLHDPKCMKLAELHSRAVDFQKSGVPVTFPELPKRLFHYIPDYQSKEVKLDDQTRYYQSPKALGKLYRRIKIRAVPSVKSDENPVPWDAHPIQRLVSRLKPETIVEEEQSEKDYVEGIFNGYVRELKGIRGIYSTGHIPLSEEEVFMGVVLEQPSGRRRDDMLQMLREVSGQLVDHVRTSLMGTTETSLELWYARALEACKLAFSEDITKGEDGDIIKDRQESQCSFGMIALRSVFECRDVFDGRRADPRLASPNSPPSIMSPSSLASPASSAFPITPMSPLSPALQLSILSPASLSPPMAFPALTPIGEELAPIKRPGQARVWANSKLRRSVP